MKRPYRLSASFVQRVREPGRYGDGRGGHGLSILVKPTARGDLSKSWCQRLYIDGRERDIGLGAYPIVSLSEARGKATENAAAIRRGENIVRVRVERVKAERTVPTVAEAARATLAIHAGSWKPGSKTAAQFRSSFAEYVAPKIGRRPVDEVTPAHVLSILAPLTTSKPETARKLRQRLSMVFRWAKTQGHRPDDPTDGIEAALPRRNGKGREHHRALPPGEVAAAIATVRESAAWLGTKLAFEFLVLTAARSGEVRLATWEEIDTEAAVWTVLADRTKTGAAHRVPLSGRALAILSEARALSSNPRGPDLVFPSARRKAQSDSTVSKLLREAGIDAVPHGFRSSFRDWCGEAGVDREVAEACLAHSRPGVEAAYARGDLLARRIEIMRAWAAHLEP